MASCIRRDHRSRSALSLDLLHYDDVEIHVCACGCAAIRRRKGLFFGHWVRMIQSLRAEEQLAKASHELEARSAAAQQRERAAEDKLQQERQRLMIETARYNTLLRKFDRNCAALSELQQQMQQQHVEQR